MLDGGCFVVNPSMLDGHHEGIMKIVEFISSGTGAKFQSQYYVTVSSGTSPTISFGGSHVVGFITHGSGELTISEKTFLLQPHNGFVIHPQETFQFRNDGTEILRMYLNVCPITSGPEFSGAMRDNFNADFRDRVAVVDRASAESMADRFFQVLIDKRQGCTTATSFIGEIPFSKAKPHRHLYEESIIVLAGSGTMWTENSKTDVNEGDVIFLPQKQEHSLQCTDANGMYVLGVIYPGDNPSINY
jgi:mannose-6-phosphate isomerase-like protein (cupin superfamily)